MGENDKFYYFIPINVYKPESIHWKQLIWLIEKMSKFVVFSNIYHCFNFKYILPGEKSTSIQSDYKIHYINFIFNKKLIIFCVRYYHCDKEWIQQHEQKCGFQFSVFFLFILNYISQWPSVCVLFRNNILDIDVVSANWNMLR